MTAPALPVTAPVRFTSVDAMLADARSRLVRRTPAQAAADVAAGALIVDIRPAWQRAVSGEVPGSLVVERNHLEWRLHPASPARLAQAVDSQRWLVICHEGYTSSLAADALRSLGVPATDIDGGFVAWRAAGLPTTQTVTAADTAVPVHCAGRAGVHQTAVPTAHKPAAGRSAHAVVRAPTGQPRADDVHLTQRRWRDAGDVAVEQHQVGDRARPDQLLVALGPERLVARSRGVGGDGLGQGQALVGQPATAGSPASFSRVIATARPGSGR